MALMAGRPGSQHAVHRQHAGSTTQQKPAIHAARTEVRSLCLTVNASLKQVRLACQHQQAAWQAEHLMDGTRISALTLQLQRFAGACKAQQIPCQAAVLRHASTSHLQLQQARSTLIWVGRHHGRQSHAGGSLPVHAAQGAFLLSPVSLLSALRSKLFVRQRELLVVQSLLCLCVPA